MTTTIAPAVGAGVLFTQQGVGTTPGYSATDLRRSDVGGLQEGVLGAGASAQDFMVQQRIAGANMQVEITMPAGGMAAVQGDTIAGQGLYDVPVHSSNVLETIGPADPSNPRVDQVILEVQDNVLDASGGNIARTRVLPGTPTGGATLTNRTGVAALPGSALLLADVLVGASVVNITNAVIRDRRKWARGACVRIVRAGGPYATTATSTVEIDNVNLKPRVECSGVPVRVSLLSSLQSSAIATINFDSFLDGVSVDTAVITSPLAPSNALLDYSTVLTPSAGSHLFSPAYAVSTGTLTVRASATSNLVFVIEEIVRQSSANNTVTTG